MLPSTTSQLYPRAIVHFDGDSFFAAVEQSLDHTLRGKVVVTGGERGAATSVSYEGKRLGLSRGMSLRDMKRICPELVVVTSDYTAYSIYARRMYAIAREFTQEVEEYSIDECFADITGLCGKYGMSYPAIAQLIKDKLEQSLGITFGVGLAPNKTIAKIASKKNKPSGLTCISQKDIHTYLADLPIEALWGMGYSTSLYMKKRGVHTALQFAEKSDAWITEHAIAKPYRDIWIELRGGYARRLTTESNSMMGSIMKSFTFVPSFDRDYVFSHLSKNVEGVCAKARRYGVKGKTAHFYIKNQDFQYFARSFEVPYPLNDPREFTQLLEPYFNEIYQKGMTYRTSGFSLHSIVAEHSETPDIFGESMKVAARKPVLGAIDSINKKFGHNTLFLAESLQAVVGAEVKRKARALRARPKIMLTGAFHKKSLNIPYVGIAH
jgi:DNA polymerase IV